MFAYRGALVIIVLVIAGAVLAGCGEATGTPPAFAAAWDSGGARLGSVDQPEGVGIGAQGELLVADTWNDRILRASPDGQVVGSFGEHGMDPGKLQCPRSVTTDKHGNIYVVDTWNHRVQKFSPEGKFVFGFGGEGGPWGYDEADGKFDYPYGVAVDSQGYIYVSDFNNNRLQKFDPRGKFVKKWGTEGRQDGQVNHPAGLAIDSEDRLYVADLGNGRIQRFDTEGNFRGKFGEFAKPYGVATDAEGDVYVADFGAHSVGKYTASGSALWVLEERGDQQGQLDMPLGVAVDEEGRVYVADWGNNRIQVFAQSSS